MWLEQREPERSLFGGWEGGEGQELMGSCRTAQALSGPWASTFSGQWGTIEGFQAERHVLSSSAHPVEKRLKETEDRSRKTNRGHDSSQE
jgi:hypothetical protein